MTPRQYATHLRTQARKKLPKLIADQNGLCVYCNNPIYLTRSRPGHEVVSVGKHTVRFKRPGSDTIHVGRIATVEHIKPIILGGDNHPLNLRAACFQCNNIRGQRIVADLAEKAKEETKSERFPLTPCKWCGSLKANLGPYCDGCKPSAKMIADDRRKIGRKKNGRQQRIKRLRGKRGQG